MIERNDLIYCRQKRLHVLSEEANFFFFLMLLKQKNKIPQLRILRLLEKNGLLR